MRRVLLVPSSTDSPFEVDIDTPEFAVHQDNPWFLGQAILSEYEGSPVFAEKVRTHYENIVMFVDEMGSYTKQPNPRVSFRFYPSYIFGSVVLMGVETIYTEDGPDLEVVDVDWSELIVSLEMTARKDR